MADWLDTFELAPTHIGYFPGSGGNRLRRKLLGNLPWDIDPNTHLHYGMEEFDIDHFEKAPKPWDRETLRPTPPILREYDVLSSHCMDSAVTRQIFPGRKIIKIYANLRLSLRRWWVVYGKKQLINEFGTDTILFPQLSDSKITLVEYAIKTYLKYYRRFIDCGHDHAVYIMPGEGEFADFMLQRFKEDDNNSAAWEFDDCWYSIARDPLWAEDIYDPYLSDPGFCQQQHEHYKCAQLT